MHAAADQISARPPGPVALTSVHGSGAAQRADGLRARLPG
jgi:hypothetical protein